MLKKMRAICLIVALLSPIYATLGATYYVKAAGGTGTGINDDNAWSLSKLNATLLNPGDRVLFKRGDVFYGTYTCNSGGSPNNPIVYDAYGTGSNPVISGFTELTSWTQYKSNIFFISLDVPTLNMVTLDGIIQATGRFPDKGYLPYSSHVGNTEISGKSINEIPFNPSGSELVIRKNRWILDRHAVKSRSGSTLSYSTNNAYGNSGMYSPINGNGYFIQNHLSTLTQEGEWYYDQVHKRLYMHFGSGSPVSRIVKASTSKQNLYLNFWANISFNNLNFEGGNVYGAYIIGTSNIKFDNCNFNFQGGDGIWGSFLKSFTVSNSSTANSLNNGIFIEQEGYNILIDHTNVTNSGLIAGMARSGDGAQEGIFIIGNGISITNCSVINSGYIGINFQGNNVLVAQNFVDAFSNVKDDGAGIYTYNPDINASDRIIRKNIILNAGGAFVGAEGHFWEPFGKAAGIYLDDRSTNTLVDQNTIANGTWGGIFLHNCGNNQITNNLIFNFSIQILFGVESIQRNRNFQITGNVFVAKTTLQKSVQIDLSVNDNPELMGVFDRNYYLRPIDNNPVLTINRTYIGGDGEKNFLLTDWQSEYAMDLNSSTSKVITSLESNFHFEYNYSAQKKIIALSNCYINILNIMFNRSIELPPYQGIILIKIPCSNQVESINSGDWTEPAVWSGGFVPGPGFKVHIKEGHLIKFSQDTSDKIINVDPDGKLQYLKDLDD